MTGGAPGMGWTGLGEIVGVREPAAFKPVPSGPKSTPAARLETRLEPFDDGPHLRPLARFSRVDQLAEG